MAIAAAVREGTERAADIAERSLARLAADRWRAVTRVLADRARADAARVDAAVAAGERVGPLAGVPFAVKDLFDVAGLPTTAGSGVLAAAPPARVDAAAVRRMTAAGAVLVATANMDEFAYGFATINAHHGTTRNPYDPARLAGGSSGGSAAVVAAGLVPVSLGSDTNGSVRVPASLTGLFGLKPTHAGLPHEGMYPFAASFDDPGPFARSLADLVRTWSVLADEPEPVLQGAAPAMARLGGRFRENADPEQLAAIDAAAPGSPLVVIPDIARARSAAFLMTAYEGGTLHRATLARDAMAYDPATRDRLIAGALIPRALYDEARAFRAGLRAGVLDAFGGHDVLLAPATPCPAPPIDDPRITIDGAAAPARAELGIHTQPVSFLGLPALCVPLARPGRLPLGLQLIGRPGGEAALFRAAAVLEAQGIVGASPPPGLEDEE